MTKEGDKKIISEYLDKLKIHLRIIEGSLELQDLDNEKNRIKWYDSLCKIKEYTLKIASEYELDIIPFNETSYPLLDVINKREKALFSVCNNIFEDQKPMEKNEILLHTPIGPLATFTNNNLFSFTQFSLQENPIDNVCINFLFTDYPSLAVGLKKAEDHNNIIDSIKYRSSNNDLFHFHNPFISQNDQENNILNPYNSVVQKTGLGRIQLQTPFLDLHPRITDFNTTIKYQQDINEHRDSVFLQDFQRLERLREFYVEKEQFHLPKMNVVIVITRTDNYECDYILGQECIEKYRNKSNELVLKLSLSKEFYNIHAEAAINQNYRKIQGEGGKNKLLEEKKFYTNKFLKLIAKYPDKRHGSITSMIWEKYQGKDNPLGGLTITSGRRTLNNWQNKVMNGEYDHFIIK